MLHILKKSEIKHFLPHFKRSFRSHKRAFFKQLVPAEPTFLDKNAMHSGKSPMKHLLRSAVICKLIRFQLSLWDLHVALTSLVHKKVMMLQPVIWTLIPLSSWFQTSEKKRLLVFSSANMCWNCKDRSTLVFCALMTRGNNVFFSNLK